MRTRKHALILRLNDSEYEHLTLQVAVTNYTMQTFLRLMILGEIMYLKPPGNFSEMLAELSTIKNNINQIISVAKMQNRISLTDIEAIEKMKDQVWLKIKDL